MLTTTTRKVCLARHTYTHPPGPPDGQSGPAGERGSVVCHKRAAGTGLSASACTVDGILNSMRSETTGRGRSYYTSMGGAAEDKKYTCVIRVKIISGVNFFLR